MDSCRDDSQTWTPAGSKSLSLSLSSTRTLSLFLSSTHAHKCSLQIEVSKKSVAEFFFGCLKGERERERGRGNRKGDECVHVCLRVSVYECLMKKY